MKPANEPAKPAAFLNYATTPSMAILNAMDEFSEGTTGTIKISGEFTSLLDFLVRYFSEGPVSKHPSSEFHPNTF